MTGRRQRPRVQAIINGAMIATVPAAWSSESILPVEVFLANAREIGVRKRAICERHGHGDVLLADEKDLAIRPSPTEQELAVSRAMERVMQGCKGAAP